MSQLNSSYSLRSQCRDDGFCNCRNTPDLPHKCRRHHRTSNSSSRKNKEEFSEFLDFSDFSDSEQECHSQLSQKSLKNLRNSQLSQSSTSTISRSQRSRRDYIPSPINKHIYHNGHIGNAISSKSSSWNGSLTSGSVTVSPLRGILRTSPDRKKLPSPKGRVTFEDLSDFDDFDELFCTSTPKSRKSSEDDSTFYPKSTTSLNGGVWNSKSEIGENLVNVESATTTSISNSDSLNIYKMLTWNTFKKGPELLFLPFQYLGSLLYWILVQFFVSEKYFLMKTSSDTNPGGGSSTFHRGHRTKTSASRKVTGQECFSDDDNVDIEEDIHGNGNGHRMTTVTRRIQYNTQTFSTPTGTLGAQVQQRRGTPLRNVDVGVGVGTMTSDVVVGHSQIASGTIARWGKQLVLLFKKDGGNISNVNDVKTKVEEIQGHRARSTRSSSRASDVIYPDQNKVFSVNGRTRNGGSQYEYKSNGINVKGVKGMTRNYGWGLAESTEDKYDKDAAEGSYVTEGVMRACRIVGKILLLLLILGLLLYLAYYYLRPVSLVSWEIAKSYFTIICNAVASAFSATWTVLYSITAYTKSAQHESFPIPVPNSAQGDNSYSAIPVNPSYPPLQPGVSKEAYEGILKKLKSIEDTLGIHQEKLALHELSHIQLKQQILQLEEAMRSVTSKGKTTEQILMEIMAFKLGETSDGRVITLTNLVTLFHTRDQEGKQDESKQNEKLQQLDIRVTEVYKRLKGDSEDLLDQVSKIESDVDSLRDYKVRVESRMDEIETQVSQAKAQVPVVQDVEVDFDKVKEAILPVMISEIEARVKISCETRNCPDPVGPEGATSTSTTYDGPSTEDINKLIGRAIAKYDADKTGRPDLALEPAGGSILSTRCTKSSKLRNSVVSLWGIKIWSPPNNPRTIIQPGVVPGECWAFEGSIGDVVIKLVAPSVVTGFTLEHIHKEVSPYGNIDTAPYEFQVLGLHTEDDVENFHNYGSFSYLDNGESLQYFPATNVTTTAFPIVELKILSNHGNLIHTCLYRFRVHGHLASGTPFTSTVQVESKFDS